MNLSERAFFILWSMISFQAGWWGYYFWLMRIKSRVVGSPGHE